MQLNRAIFLLGIVLAILMADTYAALLLLVPSLKFGLRSWPQTVIEGIQLFLVILALTCLVSAIVGVALRRRKSLWFLAIALALCAYGVFQETAYVVYRYYHPQETHFIRGELILGDFKDAIWWFVLIVANIYVFLGRIGRQHFDQYDASTRPPAMTSNPA